MTLELDALAWPADGLLPVVIADARTGDVLTLAYANREAVERTLATRETHLYSRSRQALWRKGETSGHTQAVVAVDADCDRDALVYRVIPNGPACHTGARTCFHEPVLAERAPGDGAASEPFGRVVETLAATIAARKSDAPPESYTASLFASGVARIAQKVGEEAVETVIAAMNDDGAELTAEAADLVYHLLVLLADRGVPLDAVAAELARRAAPPR